MTMRAAPIHLQQPVTTKRFPFGRLLATPAVLRAAEQHQINLAEYLTRHLAGDWGDLDPSDAKANDDALHVEERLLSAYDTPNGGPRIWIITEADRSATTVLLPSDY